MEQNLIVIFSENNPLTGELYSSLTENFGEEYSVKVSKTDEEFVEKADLIISMAYHKKEGYDIVNMDTMPELFLKFRDHDKDKPKFIFFSWFHPVEDLDQYTHLFNPEFEGYQIMNAEKCHIVRLPITTKDIKNSIHNFFKDG